MEEALTALLDSVASGRRYWVRAPQGAVRPFIVMSKVGGLPNITMAGPSGYVFNRVQIDCYADTFTALTALVRSVKAVLSGKVSGNMQGIFIDSERNLPAADAGEVTSLFRTSIDITVHYGEPS